MNNIKYLRDLTGLTQNDLAKMLNISQQAVAKWETGINQPRVDTLPKLARILNCTVDDLLKNVHSK